MFIRSYTLIYSCPHIIVQGDVNFVTPSWDTGEKILLQDDDPNVVYYSNNLLSN